jgi:choline-sulfatase
MFTGRMPEEIGLRSNDHKHIDCPTGILSNGMGHLIRRAGYLTYYGGKQHFPGYRAEDIGFDVITLNERDKLSESCEEFFKAPPEDSWLLVASFINPHDICYKAIGDYWRAAGKSNDIKRSAATAYKTMKQYDKIPEGVSEEDFYNEFCPPLPENHAPQKDEPEIIRDILAQRPFRKYVADRYRKEDWLMHRYIYKKLTEEADAQIGRVLGALDESGQSENTLTIFLSDHGDHDGSHRLEHKTVLYEEAVNVPMIVSWPSKLQKGKMLSGLVNTGLDLLPTVLGAAGADIPMHSKGYNLIPYLAGNIPPRSYVQIESEFGRAIVTQDYKYAVYDYGKNAQQLYSYKEGKGETRNYISEKYLENQINSIKEIFEREWI